MAGTLGLSIYVRGHNCNFFITLVQKINNSIQSFKLKIDCGTAEMWLLF